MPTTPPPLQDIEECKGAHSRLIVTIASLTEDDLRTPSLLPGWSRAHVLSHFVGNAKSTVRRLQAAAEGRSVEQYPGGATAREDEIALIASLPLIELMEEVQRTNGEVEATFLAYPGDAWDRPVKSINGPEHPAVRLVYSRWREVEIHHVDLGFGYEPRDWPMSLVDRVLPEAIDRLLSRTDPVDLLAWILRRGPAPKLKPWG